MKPCKRVECGALTDNPSFCSSRCSALNNNRRRYFGPLTIVCLGCSRPLDSRGVGQEFCSQQCSWIPKRRAYISLWLTGKVDGTTVDGALSKYVRDWIKAKTNGACWQCGWAEVHPTTGLIPTQIDHIDGNWQNNKPDNLRLLCPNCHALTETWGNCNNSNAPTRVRGARGRVEEALDYESS